MLKEIVMEEEIKVVLQLVVEKMELEEENKYFCFLSEGKKYNRIYDKIYYNLIVKKNFFFDSLYIFF